MNVRRRLFGGCVAGLVASAFACGDLRTTDIPGAAGNSDADAPMDVPGASDDGGAGDARTPRDGAAGPDGSVEGDAGGDPCGATAPPDAQAPDREWARWRLPPVSPPTTSYRIDAQAVCDRTTGLLWERVVGPLQTWDDAKLHCETLNLAGHTDWRLPTRIELLSIVDYEATGPAINATAFPDTLVGVPNDAGPPVATYWTATPYPTLAKRRYVVGFAYGQTRTVPTSELHAVRCVRGK